MRTMLHIPQISPALLRALLFAVSFDLVGGNVALATLIHTLDQLNGTYRGG